MKKKRNTLTSRQKQQKQRMIVLSVLGGVVALVLFCLVLSISSMIYHHFYGDRDRIDFDQYIVDQPKITQMLLTPNINSRPQTPLKRVNGVVIHYIANPGTDAKANRNYFEGRKDEEDVSANKVSSHFIIGLDGTIVQCIPLDEIAYASNDRNVDTISIECCHPKKNGKFSEETYHSLVQLTAWLCDQYHISKTDIIRHYDVTGKMCPLYYVKHPDAWKKLKNDIWVYVKKHRK